MPLPQLPIVQSGLALDQPRNTSRPVMLIGFQQEANLGIGYLASTLRAAGYRVEIFDFQLERDEILDAARRLNPLVIGFSLIFQYFVDRFGSLAHYLRENGVDCHFTIGGHFPSLSYEQALGLIPQLDSVVRFEGELTLLELADVLGRGEDWKRIEGLAYSANGETVTTPMRPLVHDLDDLPYPDRSYKDTAILGRRITPLLASRGCARTCSFCSIHMFYRTAPGKVVRTRNPAKVVEEMKRLHEERGTTIYLFQDDDFPLFGPAWRRWTREFLKELHGSGLVGKTIWKINCRADVVEPELFSEMRDAGLYLVYMGLESGTDEGLDTLNKEITVEQNIEATKVLREVGLMFEFGFMMFDPSSSFDAVRANVRFLRRITADGRVAAVFCRMLPYDGTPIKDELQRQGRLRGDVCNPDYDFLDPRLSEFYYDLKQIVDVTGWIHGYESLSPQLNHAWHEVAILEHLFPRLDGLPQYTARLSAITNRSNDLLFRIVEDLANTHEHGVLHSWDPTVLQQQAQAFLAELIAERTRFIGGNQEILLRALDQELMPMMPTA